MFFSIFPGIVRMRAPPVAIICLLYTSHQGVLQADVDLLGGAGGLEQARDLVVALLLGCLGKGGILGGGEMCIRDR